MRNFQKRYYATKKESILDHRRDSYHENLVKRKTDACRSSLIEYANNPKKKKASNNQYICNPKNKNNKYFEFKVTWGCRPRINSNYLAASLGFNIHIRNTND